MAVRRALFETLEAASRWRWPQAAVGLEYRAVLRTSESGFGGVQFAPLPPQFEEAEWTPERLRLLRPAAILGPYRPA